MSNWSNIPTWDAAHVSHVDHVHLSVHPFAWSFAERERAAIDEGWEQALARNPAYFNGVIHLTIRAELSKAGLGAHLFPTDFKTYLRWREGGFRDRSIRDTFGSALIRSREGHVILGRQRAGNVNGGLTYMPGGFIDPRDVVTEVGTGAKVIDIDGSILREAFEETGLSPADITPKPGYHISITGPHICIARELRSGRSAAELKAHIEAHIANDPNSELTDVVVVANRDDMRGLPIPSHAEVLLRALFP